LPNKRNGEETAIIGGRAGVGTMYEDRNVWGAPLPDESRKQPAVKARGEQSRPVADPGALPGVHVARQAVGRAVQRLRAQAEGIERELSRGPIGASGMVVPHLVEQSAASRTALVEIRAEIERLNSMTDDECRKWAFDRGAR
jgi:hypothetical protein